MTYFVIEKTFAHRPWRDSETTYHQVYAGADDLLTKGLYHGMRDGGILWISAFDDPSVTRFKAEDREALLSLFYRYPKTFSNCVIREVKTAELL
jgi:hypothetical protein